MSYESTQRVLNSMNQRLSALHMDGQPVMLEIEGPPKLEILSFDPLAYRKYGLIANRPPRVAGQLALRGFLSAPGFGDGAFVFAALQSSNQIYGFAMDGHNVAHRQVIQGVASFIGLPRINWE